MTGARAGEAAPRLFLVHALAAAMAPVRDALREGWPEAEAVHLLDESLGIDRARHDALPPALYERIAALASHACSSGADAILYTCSAFGPAIEAAAGATAVPVLKPDQAMFEAALGHGRRIGMVATFGPALASMVGEFEALAAAAGQGAELVTVVVPEARSALLAGDAATHHRLVADAARRMGPVDALMLAHFSMAPAAGAVRAAVPVPVLCSPEAAVARIKQLVCHSGTATRGENNAGNLRSV